MIVMMCNGCNRRIAEDDPGAARRIQLAPGELVDWCGECVAIVRAELSRVVAESRAAQRAEVQRPAAPAPVRRCISARCASGSPIGSTSSVSRDLTPLDRA
jgi:hypothetical protein